MTTTRNPTERAVTNYYVKAARQSPAVWAMLNQIWMDRETGTAYSKHHDLLDIALSERVPRIMRQVEKLKLTNGEAQIRMGILAAARKVGSTSLVPRPDGEQPPVQRKERKSTPGVKLRKEKRLDEAELKRVEVEKEKISAEELKELVTLSEEDIKLKAQLRSIEAKLPELAKRRDKLAEKLWIPSGTPGTPAYSRSFKIPGSIPGTFIEVKQSARFSQTMPWVLAEEIRTVGIPEQLWISVKLKEFFDLYRTEMESANNNLEEKKPQRAIPAFARIMARNALEMYFSTSYDLYRADGTSEKVE